MGWEAQLVPGTDQLPWLDAVWKLPKELQPLSGYRLRVPDGHAVAHLEGLAPWERAAGRWE